MPTPTLLSSSLNISRVGYGSPSFVSFVIGIHSFKRFGFGQQIPMTERATPSQKKGVLPGNPGNTPLGSKTI